MSVRVEDQGQILYALLCQFFKELFAVLGAAGIDQDWSLAHDQERVRQAEADLNDGGHGNSRMQLTPTPHVSRR